jgi:HAE1 family hydrophobic/amphiphilic exporter-1
VIGGLVLSTMLTLLVIPCVYTYFDDVSDFVSRRIFRRAPSEEPGAIVSEPVAVE